MRPEAFTDAATTGVRVRPLSLAGAGAWAAADRTGGVIDTGDVLHGGVLRTAVGASASPAHPTGPCHSRRRRRPDVPDDLPEPPEPEPPEPTHPGRRRRDSPHAAAFRVLAPRHLTSFLAGTATAGPIAAPVDIGALFDQVIAMTAPATPSPPRSATSSSTRRRRPRPDRTRADRSGPTADPRPAQTSLRRADGHRAGRARPGVAPARLDEVPANTALALRTNSSFVQAFMIGLNHELGRELLWREFPTPLTATFFQRFWDNAIDPAAPVDLDPLADWGDRALGAAPAAGERFVLLLRTELLRRFPDALVTAVRGGETRLPVFTRRAGPRRALLRLRHPRGRGRTMVDRDRRAAERPALRLRGRRRARGRQPRAGARRDVGRARPPAAPAAGPDHHPRARAAAPARPGVDDDRRRRSRPADRGRRLPPTRP